MIRKCFINITIFVLLPTSTSRITKIDYRNESLASHKYYLAFEFFGFFFIITSLFSTTFELYTQRILKYNLFLEVSDDFFSEDREKI